MRSTPASSFALSVAALILSGCGSSSSQTEGPATAEPATARVRCLGINACKAQAACDMPTHSCAGMNECRGKGWILVPRAECDAKGGRVKS